MRPRFAAGLVVLALMWGASFMFIKIMVGQIAPIGVAWIRLGGGAAFIVTVGALSGRRLPPRRRLPDVAVVALFASALPFTLIPWGEQRIDSSLAAILNAGMPCFAALFGHLMLKAERITPPRAAGLVLGFAGVAVVIGPDFRHVASQGTLGELAVVLASSCYGFGAAFMRRRLLGVDPMMLAGMQSAIGWLMITPLVVAGGAMPAFGDLSRRVLLASAALALLSSGVGLIIYYWLLAHVHAAQAALVSYLIPLSALFWGWLVLGEVVSLQVLPGIVLILGGIALVNRLPRARITPSAGAPGG